jgi:hypothetical protein
MPRHTPMTVEMIDRFADLQIRLSSYFETVNGGITQQEQLMLRDVTSIKCDLMRLDEARKDVCSILDTFRSDLPQRQRSKRELQKHIAWEWEQVNGLASAPMPALVPAG